VHALESSQLKVTGIACMVHAPVLAVQVFLKQSVSLVSSQTTTLPGSTWHVFAIQTIVPLQRSLSFAQSKSVAQGQLPGLPVQTPAEQVSFFVHAFPSSQELVLSV